MDVMGNRLVLRLGEACKRTKWAFFKLRKQMRTQFKLLLKMRKKNTSCIHSHLHQLNHYTRQHIQPNRHIDFHLNVNVEADWRLSS